MTRHDKQKSWLHHYLRSKPFSLPPKAGTPSQPRPDRRMIQALDFAPPRKVGEWAA